jgi:hypothetical protein
MTLGDILKLEGAIVEQFTVKSSEDIELGEFVVNDGAGIVAATAANSVNSNKMVALEAHDYSEATSHKISCLVHGVVVAQKVSGSGAAKKGQKLMISGTAGECTLFVAGAAPSGGATQYYQSTQETAFNTALNTNLTAIGEAYSDSIDADVVQEVRL